MAATIKKCPACSTLVEQLEDGQWPLFCPNCSASLVGESSQPGVNDPESAAGTNDQERSGTCTCGAHLPPNAKECPYCGRGTVKGQPSGSGNNCTVSLQWPWGEETLTERVFIGRVPPVKPELAAKLEGHYPTVSRVHAEIFRDGNNLFIRDYGSTNGTFINDQRIEAYTFNPVQIGDSVRLGSKLCVLFLASEGENE